MENQYGMGGDLRQYIDGRPLFPAISQPPDLHLHRPPNPYEMLVFRPDEGGGGGPVDGGRWPRQETLTLLEIRSKLDPKFKEANHKGPLWDEVSRIMTQEHGYQRSGKKCREKFENLYKYYKKTKEGKAGRQDGKHYRFFRQLEALYGDPATSSATHLHGGAAANSTYHYSFPTTNDQETYHPGSKMSDITMPDSCDYDTTSSYCSDSAAANNNNDDDDDDDARMKRRRGKGRSFKAKIEASIEAQMKTMMEKQQRWMEKMTTVIEGKEQERLLREEQWRKQDAARIDGEQKMWAAERAWLESRDAALMEAFHKLAGKEHEHRAPPPGGVMWTESDVTRLIQLRSGMELRFQENGMSSSEELLWEEIAAKMAASGSGGRSGLLCREKWDNLINDYLMKCNKKRKENAKGFAYSYDSISDDGVAGVEGAMRRLNGGSSGDHVNDGIFRYFTGDSYQRL